MTMWKATCSSRRQRGSLGSLAPDEATGLRERIASLASDGREDAVVQQTAADALEITGRAARAPSS